MGISLLFPPHAVLLFCRRTYKLQVDSYGKVNRPKTRDARSSNTVQSDLLDVLDNLEAAGHQLLGT